MADNTVPTVKVKNPNVAGEYVIINESDFVEGTHELFVESGGGASGLPDGYEAKHSGGGKYKALVGGEPLKHGEGEKAGEPVVFASKGEAIAALEAYHALVSKPAE